MILKASNLETKLVWVKKLREVIQETYLSSALPLNKSPAKTPNKNNRISRCVCLMLSNIYYFSFNLITNVDKWFFYSV